MAPQPAAFPIDHGVDPVIEAYKRDVDRTLLRENLKLSVEERIRRFESFMRGVYELRAAGINSEKAKEPRISRIHEVFFTF